MHVDMRRTPFAVISRAAAAGMVYYVISHAYYLLYTFRLSAYPTAATAHTPQTIFFLNKSKQNPQKYYPLFRIYI